MAKTLGADPTNIHWQETMPSLIETTLDPQAYFSPLLPEMLHVD